MKSRKISLLRASIVVTYYIKLLRTGADRQNGLSMSLLLLVAETTSHFLCCLKGDIHAKVATRNV